MALWHFTIASVDRFPLFPDEAVLRRAVRATITVTRDRLVAYDLVDDHAHVAAHATMAERPHLSRAIHLALRAHATPELAPTHHKQIHNRRHLLNVVEYLADQPRHHGLEQHPAVWSGSFVPDLLGARAVLDLRPTFSRALPRFSSQDLGRILAIEPDAWAPATDDEVRSAGPAILAEAAAAALLADPMLTGHRAEVVEARSVIAVLGRRCGLSTVALAATLGIAPRSVRRLAARVVPPRQLDATRRMLRLRLRCGALDWGTVS